MKNRKLMTTAFSAAMAAACCLALAPGFAFAADAQPAPSKDETVYVYTTADGSVKSEEVSTILKNPDGADELADSSMLTDLSGKDDATFSGSGPSLVWAAGGKDVSYTGSTSAEAPVAMRVTYSLDGQPIAAADLAGKSGHVTIRYDFENRSAVEATVNGVTQTIFTPFTCITALMLDGKDFKNVSVENGKVVNDGDDVIVAGYAMPGLKRSLGSIADGADVPEHFTVEADAVDFELKSTMTIVTAGLMSDFNAEGLGLGGVDGASALTDAMGQLINGSNSLAEGLDALAGSLKELESGAEGVHSGAETLSGGLYALAGDSGLLYLFNGANAIPSAVGLIGESAATMKTELQAAADALGQAGSMADAYAAAASTMAGNKDKIVKEGGMSPDDYETVVAALQSAQAMSSTVAALAGQIGASASEVDKVIDGAESLKGKAADLAGGIYQASQSASQLASGAAQLEEYAEQLSAAVPALAQGAQSAADGSKTLTQGMQAFNDQGVSQLVNTLQSDYGGMLDRMKALADAAKAYTNFGGIAQGTEGSVKFVYETDAISQD